MTTCPHPFKGQVVMSTTETAGAYRPRTMLSMEHLQKMFGCSRDTVIEYVERKVIPRPVKLGQHPQSPLRWFSDEIDAALAALPRARLRRRSSKRAA
jgi:predicted DNA-binding transcriptional regulator AlpA